MIGETSLINKHHSGQFIATSHDRFPQKVAKEEESPYLQGNLGWWNIAVFHLAIDHSTKALLIEPSTEVGNS